jgi:hypothetical protein
MTCPTDFDKEPEIRFYPASFEAWREGVEAQVTVGEEVFDLIRIEGELVQRKSKEPIESFGRKK